MPRVPHGIGRWSLRESPYPQREGELDLIFSTENLAQAKRYAAWRDAICDVYVHVDVHAEDQSNYDGFIREVQFGAVALTDVLLSHQQITRRPSHLSKLDKDGYYVQLIQTGNINVLQDGATLPTNAGLGALFCASEPYILQCLGKVRSYYLELPRKEFASRFTKDRIPISMTMSTGPGWAASQPNSAPRWRPMVRH
jgi:AraC-binding-like domain